MSFVTKQDKTRIADAIREAEAKSSGEIVTVITNQSDSYLYLPLLVASLFALLVPILLYTLPFPDLTDYTYSLQLLSFIVLSILFRIRFFQMLIIPPTVKKQRGHRLAMESFFSNNLHHTEQRTGILIFISVAEHYVEIIADKGINDRVDKVFWDTIVSSFSKKVKSGNVTEGFIEAITVCGNELEKHFPVTGKNKNELPNHLIELD